LPVLAFLALGFALEPVAFVGLAAFTGALLTFLAFGWLGLLGILHEPGVFAFAFAGVFAFAGLAFAFAGLAFAGVFAFAGLAFAGVFAFAGLAFAGVFAFAGLAFIVLGFAFEELALDVLLVVSFFCIIILCARPLA